MTEPNRLPYWISSAPLNFNFAQATLAAITEPAKTFVLGAIAASDVAGTAAAQLNQRLTTWYQSAVQPQVAEKQAWARDQADLLEDELEAGMYYYIIKPSFGGFDALLDALTPGLTNPATPEAPRFTDTLHTGGILLTLTGPPYTLYQAASTLILALTGQPATAQAALQELTTDSAVAGPVMTALADLSALPSNLWSSSAVSFKSMFETLALPKMPSVTGTNSLLTRAGAPMQASVQSVFPSEPRVRTATKLRVRGTGFMSGDVLAIGAEVFDTELTEFSGELVAALPATAQALATEGQRQVQILRKRAVVGSGSITVRPPTADEIIDELGDESLYGTWHRTFPPGADALAKPGSVANLFPVVRQVKSAVLGVLDSVGDPAYGAAVNNFVTGALRSSQQAASRATTRARTDLTRVREGLDALSQEAAALQGFALAIPPSLGGNHQLIYALQQSMNGHAQNTPNIDPDAGVIGVFFCAGDTDREKVVGGLNQLATWLNIPSWTPLT